MSDEKRPIVLRWRSAVLNSSEPSSVKLTLLALAEHASPSGGKCYPGVDTLAAQTSQGEKTCRRALDAADGRWFTRTPMKFSGRHWRGYSYQLRIPDGAVTMTGPRREVAVTMTGPQGASCGHSVPELRSLSPRAAVTVTDELGKAPRKSNKERARARKTESVRLPTWLAPDAWQAWKQHRGSKFSAQAQKLAITKLETLRSEGHDPVKLINRAIESCWSSFYPHESTKANNGAAGHIDRDARSEDELAAANEAELARFWGDAA
ncbi:helix-turn-helix domain-containing protein [Marilutibacter maris]|uniref:helix-turn-helix domain-containing protein n=1 Tax=Marilutibacter maris TaxID=1605891 RepID=UPI000DA81C83|nr:helix-turn-helix domain-containing protein [Lysobacter maris]